VTWATVAAPELRTRAQLRTTVQQIGSGLGMQPSGIGRTGSHVDREQSFAKSKADGRSNSDSLEPRSAVNFVCLAPAILNSMGRSSL